MTIRNGRAEELLKIQELAISCLREYPWSWSLMNALFDWRFYWWHIFKKRILVAVTEDDIIQGMVLVKGCRVGHLFIRPKYRSQGIGTMLLKTAEKLVRQKGHDHVQLVANGSLAFFVKHGYQARDPVPMVKDLK